MRVVQALHWLKDTLPSDGDQIRSRLLNILQDKKHGPAIRQDLIQGFSVLPSWMQLYLRTFPGFDPAPGGIDNDAPGVTRLKRARTQSTPRNVPQ